MDGIIVGSIAVITVCLMYIAKLIFIKDTIDKYVPYLIIAFKWVESTIPDDYGKNDTDPIVSKALHKTDMFLKQFAVIYLQVFGDNPDAKLLELAKEWLGTYVTLLKTK